MSLTRQKKNGWLTRRDADLGRPDQADGIVGRALAMAAETGNEILALLGHVDHLTLLPNRLQFMTDTTRLVEQNGGSGRTLVLVTLAEASHFNQILRAIGHVYAEAFLRAGAERLRESLGGDCDIYHVSLLSLVFVTDDSDAEAVAERLMRAFRTPLTVLGIPIDSDVGIGLARLPDETDWIADALRKSLAAAQDSRAARLGWAWYDTQRDQALVRGFRILSELKTAVHENAGLSLNFQPRIDMRTGALAGAEALVRWHHPEFGMVSPGEFVPLAETSALVRPLTRWVVRNAISTFAAWHRSGIETRISINVSPKNLSEPDFPDFIAAVCAEHGVDPALVELEFTEGALALNGKRTLEHMEALRASGISLAIDDFGSGYSNMSYLATLPTNILKIDQTFIRPLDERPRNATLIRSIIALGHDLGYRVVGEGIETQASFDKLQRWGCDEGQGYLMSRPLSDADFQAWHRNR